jgi:hypothetical protein
MVLVDLPHQREQVLPSMADAHRSHRDSPHSYKIPVQVYGKSGTRVPGALSHIAMGSQGQEADLITVR